MTYKVIQWYTGAIAREQIRLIQASKNLELVGAVVHHDNKVGMDIGEIIKGDLTGIKTLGDAKEALKIDADVVLYNAPFERYDEIIAILASGKNVITPSGAFLSKLKPESQDLLAACESGQSTLLGTGVNPGFAGDVLPLLASSLCARVRSVHVREVGDVRSWDPFMLTEVMKFGSEVEELEKSPEYFDFMTNSFQQSCQMLAEALSFTVDSVTTNAKFAKAKSDALDGKIKAGSVGGILLEVSVISDGVTVVKEDLLWKVCDDLDPSWDIDPEAGEWQITIDGDPNVKIETTLSSGSGQKGTGLLATAARMINSIPDVCEAEPGFLTVCNGPVPRCMNN